MIRYACFVFEALCSAAVKYNVIKLPTAIASHTFGNNVKIT